MWEQQRKRWGRALRFAVDPWTHMNALRWRINSSSCLCIQSPGGAKIGPLTVEAKFWEETGTDMHWLGPGVIIMIIITVFKGSASGLCWFKAVALSCKASPPHGRSDGSTCFMLRQCSDGTNLGISVLFMATVNPPHESLHQLCCTQFASQPMLHHQPS